MPVYKGPSTNGPLLACALFPYFIVAIYIFSCCTFSILRSFHVGLLSYGIICMLHFLYSNLFMLHCFSCCILFIYYTTWCCNFTRCNVFVFHSSPVALCACCNFFFFQFVHISLIPKLQPGHLQISKMESFVTIISKAVKYCNKALHLRCSQGSGYMSTIFMLLFLNIGKYWKWLKDRKHNQKSDITISTVNLFHFYFDIL